MVELNTVIQIFNSRSLKVNFEKMIPSKLINTKFNRLLYITILQWKGRIRLKWELWGNFEVTTISLE